MANRFANGAKSFGFCDVCSFRFPLKKLKNLVVKTKRTSIKACGQCWTPDHPQLQLGMYPVSDPQALRDPRPDRNTWYQSGPLANGSLGEGSRIIEWGWNPIGGSRGVAAALTPNALAPQGSVGQVQTPGTVLSTAPPPPPPAPVITTPTGVASTPSVGTATVDIIAPSGNQTFTYTGSDQSWVVPAGITSVTVKMWGGGGAGGSRQPIPLFDAAAGGGAGYVTGALAVTPGETLTIVIGGGGTQANTGSTNSASYGGGGSGWGGGNQNGGGGGGRSAIRRGSTELVTAAGGGGGASYDPPAIGGAGGGASGTAGVTGVGGGGGGGGTQIAGGVAGAATGPGTPATAGSSLQGGNGGGVDGSGGGGGGGYFGGGGGGGGTAGFGGGSGGGGGSSYIGGLTSASTTAGSGTVPGNSSDPIRGTAGNGGAQRVAGSNGLGYIIWGSVDPYYSNVSLLLHMDGANGGTTFTDNSPSPKTVTANGGAVTSTAVVKYGTASAAFDGSGDYLSIPNDTAFELGADNFTLEGWIYLTGYSPTYTGPGAGYYAQIFNKDTLNNRGWYFFVSGNATSWTALEVNLFSNNTTPISSSGTFNFLLNTWYHVAAVRNGTSLRLYVNGFDIGGNINGTTVQTTAADLQIGSQSPYWASQGYGYYFPGHIDDLRITKGVARYTANFTPPLAPFPNS